MLNVIWGAETQDLRKVRQAHAGRDNGQKREGTACDRSQYYGGHGAPADDPWLVHEPSAVGEHRLYRPGRTDPVCTTWKDGRKLDGMCQYKACVRTVLSLNTFFSTAPTVSVPATSRNGAAVMAPNESISTPWPDTTCGNCATGSLVPDRLIGESYEVLVESMAKVCDLFHEQRRGRQNGCRLVRSAFSMFKISASERQYQDADTGRTCRSFCGTRNSSPRRMMNENVSQYFE